MSGIQAQAIQNLPIEKVIVWDGGGKDGAGLRGLGGRLMGTLPAIHDLARQVGLDLPEFLGRLAQETETTTGAAKPASDKTA